MFLRDLERLADCRVRINRCPLGAAALAGTTYPIDRTLTASLLGFDGICENSVDAVSDRDYIAELAFVNALIAMHVSRLAEEVTLWASYEFRFVELSDEFSTGSSIDPATVIGIRMPALRKLASEFFNDQKNDSLASGVAVDGYFVCM